MRSRGLLSRTVLVLGLVFLYVPIASMMVFSFNNSRLVTVWDAAHSPTLKWYRALAGMTTAPIVMPEVITGLSLLLLFVAMGQLIGWPHGVGAVTITLAHITFCMAYVTVVVQSRLAGFDESLEEAAMDLGARPLRVFWRITLPLILPAIASGWLLAFTLSWDDLVITQFVAGPGSSTLPMVIFSKVRFGVTPDINALATIMVLIVATGIALSTVWMRYRERRRARDLQLAAAANL